MKRYLIFLLILFMTFACTNQNGSVQDEYYAYLEKITTNNSYSTTKEPCEIMVSKTDSSYDKYHYSIIISEPTIDMEDLKVIAYPLDFATDELVPNFNILESVDVTTFNNKQTA
ncbi:hypothetical protein LJB88_05215, partial [Erysipelotrichaceae bacterium OttesenSCG-928-M19]|nr:hypothetical protein [Erysipelotrichaceae bacterium OttesenSCG-928-M19]